MEENELPGSGKDLAVPLCLKSEVVSNSLEQQA